MYPYSTWEPRAYRAKAAGKLAQEVVLLQLRTGLVLIKQGELELLYLLKVVLQHELLGEGWVEVVDSCFCSVVLAEGHGSERQSRHVMVARFPL